MQKQLSYGATDIELTLVLKKLAAFKYSIFFSYLFILSIEQHLLDTCAGKPLSYGATDI